MIQPRRNSQGERPHVVGAYTRYAITPRSDIDPTTHGSEGGDDGWKRTPGGGYIRGREYYPPVATYDSMVNAGHPGGPLNLDQFGAIN